MAAENAVQSGDSDIKDALNLVSHDIGGDRCFFCDGDVAGSGAEYGDGALSFRQRFLLERQAARFLVVGGMFGEFLAEG